MNTRELKTRITQDLCDLIIDCGVNDGKEVNDKNTDIDSAAKIIADTLTTFFNYNLVVADEFPQQLKSKIIKNLEAKQ